MAQLKTHLTLWNLEVTSRVAQVEKALELFAKFIGNYFDSAAKQSWLNNLDGLPEKLDFDKLKREENESVFYQCATEYKGGRVRLEATYVNPIYSHIKTYNTRIASFTFFDNRLRNLEEPFSKTRLMSFFGDLSFATDPMWAEWIDDWYFDLGLPKKYADIDPNYAPVGVGPLNYLSDRIDNKVKSTYDGYPWEQKIQSETGTVYVLCDGFPTYEEDWKLYKTVLDKLNLSQFICLGS